MSENNLQNRTNISSSETVSENIQKNDPAPAITNISTSSQSQNLDIYRLEYRNTLYVPPNQPSLQLQTANSLPHSGSGYPLQTSADNFYLLNPQRNYGPEFENKIIAFQIASKNALQILILNDNFSANNLSEYKVLSLLRSMNAQEMKLTADLYQKQFSKDFEADIRNLLKGDSRNFLSYENILKGEKSQSLAIDLNTALDRLKSGNINGLFEIIKDSDKKTLLEAQQLLQEKFGKDILKELNGVLSKEEFYLLKLSLSGDLHAEKALQLKQLIEKSEQNPENLFRFLRDTPNAELEQIKNIYKSICHSELDQDIQKISGSANKEMIKTLFAGDRITAEALYLHKHISESDLTLSKLEQSLKHLDISNINSIENIYRDRFNRSLTDEISKFLAGNPNELMIAKQLLQAEKMNEGAKLFILLKETEKDISRSGKLIESMQNKSQNEMIQIKEELVRNHNLNIDSHLSNILKGNEGFKARLSAYGKPDTIEDEVIKSLALHEYERNNKTRLSEKFLERLNNKGSLTDSDLEKIEKHYRKIESMKELLNEDDELLFYSLLDFFEARLSSYEKSKKRFYSIFHSTIAIIAALCAYIITMETSHSQILSAAVSSAAFFISKQLAIRQHIRSLNTEKALENFKARRRKRKKSHKSRRRLQSREKHRR